jgi:hypothetical protein
MVTSNSPAPATVRANSFAEKELTLTFSSSNRVRAEAAFKKVQKTREGEKARTEHEAEAQSVVEKTARLRALRLAKEAIKLDLQSQTSQSLRATTLHLKTKG